MSNLYSTIWMERWSSSIRMLQRVNSSHPRLKVAMRRRFQTARMMECWRSLASRRRVRGKCAQEKSFGNLRIRYLKNTWAKSTQISMALSKQIDFTRWCSTRKTSTSWDTLSSNCKNQYLIPRASHLVEVEAAAVVWVWVKAKIKIHSKRARMAQSELDRSAPAAIASTQNRTNQIYQKDSIFQRGASKRWDWKPKGKRSKKRRSYRESRKTKKNGKQASTLLNCSTGLISRKIIITSLINWKMNIREGLCTHLPLILQVEIKITRFIYQWYLSAL